MDDASRIFDDDLRLMLARERIADLEQAWTSANGRRRDRAARAGVRRRLRYSPAGAAPRSGAIQSARLALGRAAIALGRAIGGPEVA